MTVTQAVGSQVTATTTSRLVPLVPLLVNNPLGGHVYLRLNRRHHQFHRRQHKLRHFRHIRLSKIHHMFQVSLRFQRLLLCHYLRLHRTIQDDHGNEFNGRHHHSQEAFHQLHHHSSHSQTPLCLLPAVRIHHRLQVLRQVQAHLWAHSPYRCHHRRFLHQEINRDLAEFSSHRQGQAD